MSHSYHPHYTHWQGTAPQGVTLVNMQTTLGMDYIIKSYNWKQRPTCMSTTLAPDKVPNTSFPECPGAVDTGNPGMEQYGRTTASQTRLASSPIKCFWLNLHRMHSSVTKSGATDNTNIGLGINLGEDKVCCWLKRHAREWIRRIRRAEAWFW